MSPVTSLPQAELAQESLDALQLDPGDDVATMLRAMTAGEMARIGSRSGLLTVVLVDPVPIHHKVAVRAIAPGAQVRKYGEVIGQAQQAIALGAHVHTHNLKSLRARV
jgi:hypothetical protein